MRRVIENFIGIFHNYQNKVALICDAQQFTYAELLQAVNSRRAFLNERRLKVGDTIAIANGSRLEQLLWALTSIFDGLTLVPINSSMPEKINQFIVGSTQPKLMIWNNEEFKPSQSNDVPWKTRPSDSPQTIHYTSGTTGLPKGVCHTIERLLGNAQAFNQHMGIDESVCMLHVMPVTYMAGFLNTFLVPLMAGGTVILAPQFNSQSGIMLWENAISHTANAIWLTPTMAHFLAKCSRNPQTAAWVKDHIKYVLVGTAPLLTATRNFFESTFNVPCLESYGLSELLLLTSQKKEESSLSVGNAIPGVELQILSAENTVLASNEIGTVYAKTKFNMLGYLNPDTHQVDRQYTEWFNTGDLGYLDQNNELYITGRAKDIIIKGGVNISPRQVEEALMGLEGIQEASVIGTPHPFWGEQVLAFIVLTPTSCLNENDIKSYLKNHLSLDAIPEIIKFISALPRSNTGKVQAHLLKEMA